ncbi:hypothetical protein EJB05_23107, partial [Eragrostis curvula]
MADHSVDGELIYYWADQLQLMLPPNSSAVDAPKIEGTIIRFIHLLLQEVLGQLAMKPVKVASEWDGRLRSRMSPTEALPVFGPFNFDMNEPPHEEQSEKANVDQTKKTPVEDSNHDAAGILKKQVEAPKETGGSRKNNKKDRVK